MVTPLAISAGTTQGARSVEIPAPATRPMNRCAFANRSPTNSPTMTATTTCSTTALSWCGATFSVA